jgi:hypothetical protein
MTRTILLIALGLLFSTPALAGVYKWTDEEGNVHFGDRPPSQEGAEQVKVPKSAPPSQAPDAKERWETQQRMLEIYKEDREKKKQAKAEEKRKRKEMEARCVIARDQLKSYKDAVLYDLEEDGKRRYYDEEEKQATIAQLQAQIKKHCK